MKEKKSVVVPLLVLLLLFHLLFPISACAEEVASNEFRVNIGFQEEPSPSMPIPVEPAPSEPAPVNNVLPLTLGQTKYQADQPQAASRGTLPKTGEQRQAVFLRIIGLGCIASCFWLFLFTRLREEEKENA